MRWVTLQTEQGPRACGWWEGRYVDINAADPSLPASVRGLIALGA
ncbi:MAG: fumarylacetoacetate hydrolase, partial [Isosphaeraceae bacterium]|nr:fumarylacetoacetate hydrolase [Isosphaeraceae bacterium]